MKLNHILNKCVVAMMMCVENAEGTDNPDAPTAPDCQNEEANTKACTSETACSFIELCLKAKVPLYILDAQDCTGQRYVEVYCHMRPNPNPEEFIHLYDAYHMHLYAESIMQQCTTFAKYLSSLSKTQS